MYTNLNSRWAFRGKVKAEVTIGSGLAGTIDVDVPGVSGITDIATISAIEVDDPDFTSLNFGSAKTSLNTVTLVLYNNDFADGSVVIPAGTYVKGEIARCDNGFNSSGL